MDLNSLLIWLALGAIAGWAAGQLMKGKGLGLLGNIAVGILGSFVGGWLGAQLNIEGVTTGGLSLPSILTAIGGSVVVLFLLGLLRKSRS